jgi:hypothetical protein
VLALDTNSGNPGHAPTRRVYWIDSELKIMESSDYDGKDRKTIVRKDLLEPSGLAVFGDYLYFIDWKRKSVDRVNKVKIHNL